MRFLLTIQYLGTRFAGWQTQANAVGVQQVIESAISRLCGEPVGIEGAGRTDSGVHAHGQRAHADIPITISPYGLLHGLNDLLPHDVRVVAAEEVGPAFHCRFDASRKTYRYAIWNDRVADVFHYETSLHVVPQLDERLMQAAAATLCGHHDFKAFTVASPTVSSTWRTVQLIVVERDQSLVTITATADGFLRYMVRRMAGSLIEVGKGRLPVSAVAKSLEPDFGVAKWTAPAKGLTLLSVEYDSIPHERETDSGTS